MRKQLGVAKVVLLGHSWGGMLAQAYASKYPTRTAKLILVASGGPDLSFLSYFSDNIDMRLTEADIAALTAAEKVEDFRKRTNEQLVARMPGYFYSREKALRAKDEARKVLDFNVALMTPLLQRYDATKTLGNYKGPVFLIQGRQDPVDPTTAFQIKGLLPQTSMIWIEQCGHFPWIEQPQAFSKALTAALR
jgi:proline iminopeptidase